MKTNRYLCVLLLLFVSISIFGQQKGDNVPEEKIRRFISLSEEIGKRTAAGDFERAIKNANEAVKMAEETGNPEFVAPALTLRGITYFVSGDSEKAKTDYDRAIKLDPSYADPYEGRAEYYLAREEIAKAKADAEKALQLDKSLTNVHAVFSGIHFYEDEYKKSIASANKALKDDAENLLALEYRGMSYASLGDHDKAIDDLTMVIASQPENLNVLAFRMSMFFTTKKYTEAISDSERVIKLDGSYAPAYGARAISSLLLGRNFAQVVSDFEMVEKLDPSDADSDHYFLKARALRELGKTAEAEAAEKKSKELAEKEKSQ